MPDGDDTKLAVPDGTGQGAKPSSAPASGQGEKAKLIGGFEVVRKIGAGAMGEVYLAKQVGTGREVALKIIAKRFTEDADFIKRFDREIELLSKLDHPNIARSISHGVHEGSPFLAMEFVPGPCLADLLKSQGAIPEIDALRLTIQIARGLEYVHDKAGLVHRDVKPANILVAVADHGHVDSRVGSTGDVAKLIDFGLAKAVGNKSQDMSLTMTGMVMGTPYYMSPEQIRGEKDLDLRTDIYALGATAYHLLTGKYPYDGASPGMVMTEHLTAKIPDPGLRVPSLHHFTRQMVMTAMAKNRKERFLNYQGMIGACEKALSSLAAQENGSMRLLRKPMVLTPNTRSFTKGESKRQPVEPALPHLEEEDDPFGTEGSSHIFRRKPERPAPKQPPAPPGGQSARAQPTDVLDANEDPTQPGTSALRRAQTDKIKKLQTTRYHRKIDPKQVDPDIAGLVDPERTVAAQPGSDKIVAGKTESAVYHKNDPESRLADLIPWALLLLSAAALVALAMMHGD